MRRLLQWLAFIGVSSVLAAGCSADPAPGPPASPGSTVGAGERQPVIVDLAVARDPQSGVERAQDDVLRALGGHGTLTRRLTATAQMAVSVDEEGRRILSRLPVVARVHEDTADQATGAAAGAGVLQAGEAPATTVAAPAAPGAPGAPGAPTTVRPATTAPAAVQVPATTTVAPGARDQFIVDLAVSPQSPAAVERAQDDVVRALGAHGALARRLTETAQMAVSVDAEGRRILGAHPLVARVHQDTPSAADTTS